MRGSCLMKVWLTVLGLLVPSAFCTGIGCRNNKGNHVDWFFVYKLPKLDGSSEALVRDGVGQAYMDTTSQEWTLLGQGINETDHAVYNTLQQVYKYADSEDVAYLFYDDEEPCGPVSLNHGHTKGDIAFDKTSGFWLIHSVPKFPPSADSGYKYPSTGMRYGQSFLCISFNYKFFNEIGQQLLYNYPKIYDYKLPSAFQKDNPFVAAALNKTHVNSPPWNRTVDLTSSGGIQFVSFAKYSSYGKDLYHDWVAPYFKSDLQVETWIHGHELPSNCSQYKVFNVKSLKIVTEEFEEIDDHSKWAVTSSNAATWICIGDINRMNTQEKRAGGTVCGSLPKAWKNFKSAITKIEDCDTRFPEFMYSV